MSHHTHYDRTLSDPALRDVDVEPQSTDEARRAIRETRVRISETLGDIEVILNDKKERLKDRVNVLRPVTDRVRSSPWPAVGVAFTAGLVLSRIGGDADEDERAEERGLRAASDRDEVREWRRRRRRRLSRAREHHDEKDGDGESTVGALRTAIVGALANVIGDGFRRYG